MRATATVGPLLHITVRQKLLRNKLALIIQTHGLYASFFLEICLYGCSCKIVFYIYKLYIHNSWQKIKKIKRKNAACYYYSPLGSVTGRWLGLSSFRDRQTYLKTQWVTNQTPSCFMLVLPISQRHLTAVRAEAVCRWLHCVSVIPRTACRCFKLVFRPSLAQRVSIWQAHKSHARTHVGPLHI